TIANYWNNSFRQFPSLLLNNFRETEDAILLFDLTEANFNNCIIYGNDNPEFILDEVADPGNMFNFKFINSLVRFQDPNNNFSDDNYDFDNVTHYENMRFNNDPDFKNVRNNEMIIGLDSGAINFGANPFSNNVPEDILTINRTAAPDAGAYQHTEF
ncbi:MAG: hypothetical protein CMC55_07230, partial [Flavobacteriaceae bacterium]|nr:hypothetical protein [Flavobacteriaceae bacterium]